MEDLNLLMEERAERADHPAEASEMSMIDRYFRSVFLRERTQNEDVSEDKFDNNKPAGWLSSATTPEKAEHALSILGFS